MSTEGTYSHTPGDVSQINLANQFVLSRTADIRFKSWRTSKHGAWCLHTHPSLPVLDVHDSKTAHLGWILGWPIDIEKREILSDSIVFLKNRVTEEIYSLGGRWIALLVAVDRVYLCPTGGLSCVYSPPQHLVASTTTVLPATFDTGDYRSLRLELNIPHDENWYPFGLTPEPGIHRLMPNYFLDLHRFSAIRHWPRQQDFKTDDNRALSKEIGEIANAQIAAVIKNYPLQGNLTAGRDSRMILACAREWIGDIEFLTRTSRLCGHKLDTYVARRLASRFALRSRIIGDVQASDSDLAAWVKRTGCCVGGLVWRSIGTWKQSDPTKAGIPGVLGEIGRAYYKTDDASALTDARLLLQLLHLPSHPLLVDAGEKWLDSLPPLSERRLLDILYLEQRIGCWAAPTRYGSVAPAPEFWVLSHRECIRNMLSFSDEYKERSQMATDIMEYRWPELLTFPFNRAFGRYVLSDLACRIGRKLGRRSSRFSLFSFQRAPR